MGRPKRHNVFDYNKNKKQKLEHEIKTKKSHFENLANETIYEIFEYLDVYHIYECFFYLNQRFQNLIVNPNFPIQINIGTISKSSFVNYLKNMIKPNKDRINYLRLSNGFIVDIIFSPPRIICDFIQLETLILDNIDAKYLNNILKYLASLPKLHSLVLTPIDYVKETRILFTSIFHLPKLKSCKLTCQTKDDEQPKPIYLTDFNDSPIEYFVINCRVSIESLSDIFLCLPKLRYLSINCLVGSDYTEIDEDPITSKYLKYVSIKLDDTSFDLFEELIKSFFGSVQVLRLTTDFDLEYLDAKRWEKLIISSMPNLRIFDFHHNDSVEDNHLLYHDLMNKFNSSFWIQRQWFFTHQHDWQQSLDSGIFYSTNPYQRKDYTFYWEFDQQLCSHIKEKNLDSIKYMRICSKQATNNCVNYFPNVTELTLQHYFKTPDDSISITLNRILPLKQLTKLVIQEYNFPFEEVIKLLYYTPNLHSLKLDLLLLNESNLKSIQQSETFRHISNTNKIKNLELREHCTLEDFQLIMDLFPRIENLKTGLNRKEIHQIIQFVFSKANHKTYHLFFLCISRIPKICLKELNLLIRSKHLVNDYSIKYIDRDLYLWW